MNQKQPRFQINDDETVGPLPPLLSEGLPDHIGGGLRAVTSPDAVAERKAKIEAVTQRDNRRRNRTLAGVALATTLGVATVLTMGRAIDNSPTTKLMLKNDRANAHVDTSTTEVTPVTDVVPSVSGEPQGQEAGLIPAATEEQQGATQSHQTVPFDGHDGM